MTDQADHNDPQIREAVARAMLDDSDSAGVQQGGAAGGGRLADAVDPKQLFCDNWDTVKQVLNFLKPFLPQKLQGIVDMIIKAGDTLKQLICR